MKILLFNKKTNSDNLLRAVLKEGSIKVGIALLILMTVGYIFQINDITKKTYAVQRYTVEIRSVMDQSREQEYSFLQSNSLSRVDALIERSDFKKVNRIHYIEIPESEVASK